MRIKKEGGFSGYHIYLNLALDEAVGEYERTFTEIQNHPSFTEEIEEDETLGLIRLQYRLKQKFTTTILLAACCVEALGNLFLAIKTTPDQFASLERASFIEKWTVIPSQFLPEYTLPQDGQLYGDLRRLQIYRNAIAHLKEEVIRGKTVVHSGSLPKTASDEHVFISRCRTLPIRLVKHLIKFDQSTEPRLKLMAVTLSFKFPIEPP